MPHRPPLLFLHGAFAGPEVWSRFVAPWFAARGYRVAVPELAAATGRPLRLRDYVAAARAAAAELGEKPVAIGHSLGGLVAQHLAAEMRLSGTILVASPGPMGLGPTLWNLSTRSRDVLVALVLAQVGAGALIDTEAVRRALFTEETPADWIAEVAPRPAAESPAALLDGLAWDLPVWPFAWWTPTLAIRGEHDAFVPASDLWALRMAYGAETAVLPNTAHGLPIDPHWKSLAWRINAWLEERAIGAAPAARRLA